MERKTIKVISQGMVAETKSHTPEASPSAGEPSMPLKVQGGTVFLCPQWPVMELSSSTAILRRARP